MTPLLVRHGYGAPTVRPPCPRECHTVTGHPLCAPRAPGVSVGSSGKEVVPPNNPQGMPTQAPLPGGGRVGPPGTAAMSGQPAWPPGARLGVDGEGLHGVGGPPGPGGLRSTTASPRRCHSALTPHPGGREQSPRSPAVESRVRSMSRGMEGPAWGLLAEVASDQPPRHANEVLGERGGRQPFPYGVGRQLRRPEHKRDNQSGRSRAGEAGRRQGTPMQRARQGPRSSPHHLGQAGAVGGQQRGR